MTARRVAAVAALALWAAGAVAGAPPGPPTAAGDPDWYIPPPPAGAPEPTAPEYLALRQAEARYREIRDAGGWGVVPPGAELGPGVRDPRVDALRRRLRASGDFAADMQADAWFYDTALADAVRTFQVRHGLRPTGALDERTREAANVPVDERLAQIEATLERWRWLPREWPARHARVNIPTAELQVFDGGQPVLTMRAIVGHPDRPTPSFRAELRQVVFNPAWSVPHVIAVEDLLPEQQRDPGFLARAHIRVLRPTDGAEVDPAHVPWQALGPDRFPYRLQQVAGPWNSLGRLKFDLDDPFDIYLHDTPSRGLFGLNRRTLSSGCIRLEDPVSLAALLLDGDAGANAGVTDRLARGRTRSVALPAPLPVYVVYLGTRVDDAGRVHFAPDVYGRDARLRAALGAARLARNPVR